jgi:hypothetical protein
MADLLRHAWGWVKGAKAAGRTQLLDWQLVNLRTRYDGHVVQGYDANPPPPGNGEPTANPARSSSGWPHAARTSCGSPSTLLCRLTTTRLSVPCG